jgi:Domain of unknown function (DUF1931)
LSRQSISGHSPGRWACLKRYSDFINRKIDDLLVRAEAVAKANGRAVIQPFELPIIKGLQQSIHEFEKIDEEIELRPILEHLAIQQPLELAERAVGSCR